MSHVILLKTKLFYNAFTFTISCEMSNTISFPSSIMKNIVVFPALSKLVSKLICWIVLGSVSRASCLLKSILIFCNLS